MNNRNIIGQVINDVANRVPGKDFHDGDYTGEDGLLYCGKCNTPKRCWVEFLGQRRAMPIMCECEKEKDRKRIEAENAAKLAAKIDRMRRDCFPTYETEQATFKLDDRHDPKISDAMHRYVDQWEEMKRQNMGLLLYGSVGTGKTFYAGCIANALLDKGIPCKLTSFARIVNGLQGMQNGRQDWIDKLVGYPLLIIDDLGAERSSDYMLEQVYSVVDARYQAGLPLIVTTNVPIKEIKEPLDLKYKRIYDRILSMCFPVKIDGVSRRREALKANFADRAKLLGLK